MSNNLLSTAINIYTGWQRLVCFLQAFTVDTDLI